MKSIEDKQSRGKFMRTIEANQDTADIAERYRRIESLFRQLQVSTRPLILYGGLTDS